MKSTKYRKFSFFSNYDGVDSGKLRRMLSEIFSDL